RAGGGQGTAGQVAPATQLAEKGAFSVDGSVGSGVVDASHELQDVVIVVPALDRQRSLGHLGQDHRGVEDLGGPVGQAEPLEGGQGNDHGVELARLGNAGLDVPPQRSEGEVGTGGG